MNWAWAASLDQLWRSPSFPIWATLVAGVFFGLVLLVTLFRAEKSMANGALAVITLLAIAVAVASGLRGFGGGSRTIVASNQSIQQPVTMLPALSCLDGLAGENVEAACERALFASADSTAAAVSYTANQITRLTSLGDTVAASKIMTPELSTLRRVIERDRYGLAAQVLLTREKCSPTACDMFRSLSNWRRVSENMADGAYEGLVGRYAANWTAQPPLAPQPSVASIPSAALAGVPGAISPGRPSTVEFPTAASIPPVNIMGTEPPAPSPAAAQAAPPRNQAPPVPPTGAQQPPSPRQAATTAASPPAVAAKKQLPPKQQRTTAPVQLAPPVEADDN